MNYFVKRGDQEYGPYTLAALQQYVAQGNIASTDLARSEAMTDWRPVSEVLGNVQVPSPTANFGATTSRQAGPLPPKLHWGIVLALSLVTFGIFAVIWLFVQASWIKKVRPQSRAIVFLVGYLGSFFVGAVLDGTLGTGFFAPIGQIAGLVFFLFAIFGMRSDIEDYYKTLNPAGLSLGGVMTFFFNSLYFQYHLTHIYEEIESGRLGSAAAIG